VILLVLSLLAVGLVLGFAFAGSPAKLAKGVRIDGVDVGGLDAKAARALLEQRAARLGDKPVVFAAGGRRFPIRPKELGVEADWKSAVDAAQRQGDGFGPLRGFKRLDVDFFGADITPPTTALNGALEYKLGLIAASVNRPPRQASVVRHGLHVAVLPERSGLTLDLHTAKGTIVHRLASLERGPKPVVLPLRTAQPTVHAADLARAAVQARRVLSAPVRLQLEGRTWLLPRYRLAQLLQLPAGGRTELRIGGSAAAHWLQRLARRVDRPAADATFAVDGRHVRVVPAKPGLRLDPAGTRAALLRAALRPRARVARVAVVTARAKLSTARAQAMRIRGLVSSYTTIYGGIPNRIHNVQLVAHLVDDKLIAPGATFSFNKTTGERNAAKGFLEAPVIVNGELTTGLGGGVCQVSTTVFNAAFDAGLKITERTNHALYISHYPQGRDATVDYPDVDLKFVNDTGNWLLLRTFVGSYSLTVSLYGTPTGRKVQSSTTPLVAHGSAPVVRTVDASLRPGETVVDDSGSPALTTSVTRDVYTRTGRLLHHDVWYSSYRAEPELIRVGPPAPKPTPEPATTTTQTTTTSPTTTQATTTAQTTTSKTKTPPPPR
jgi:vancomycin resistance protein YoaR